MVVKKSSKKFSSLFDKLPASQYLQQ